jgi:hypothetical protein
LAVSVAVVTVPPGPFAVSVADVIVPPGVAVGAGACGVSGWVAVAPATPASDARRSATITDARAFMFPKRTSGHSGSLYGGAASASERLLCAKMGFAGHVLHSGSSVKIGSMKNIRSSLTGTERATFRTTLIQAA